MGDLISRDAALNAIDCWHIDFNSMDGAKVQTDCWRIIKELPAVDAVPVVHGHWTRIHIKGKEYGKVYYQHENCVPLLFESPYHYCPHCGAKMDEHGKDGYINE